MEHLEENKRLANLYDYVFIADLTRHEITLGDVKSETYNRNCLQYATERGSDRRVMATARVAAPCRATATPMGGFSESGLRWEAREREKSCLGFYTFTIYDALVCLTACYPKKFGPRGVGHAGIMWIGLQCDIEDEGYAPP